MGFFLVIIIAISLSMDAFSLSLAYGTLGVSKKQIYILSLIVGIFHFFMSLIGLFIGSSILNIIKIDTNYIVFIVLLIIGMEMIYESFKEKEDMKIMEKLELFFFAFAVSIDSFSVGLTLTSINDNYILSSFIFAVTSFIFTFLGLILGNKIKNLVGRISTIIGGIVLMVIGIMYIF